VFQLVNAPRIIAMKASVVINPNSGSAGAMTGEELLAELATGGVEASIAQGDTLDVQIANALASDAEIVVAVGGDGTITAVATSIAGTGKQLGILPMGTANLLARDLNIPLDWRQAAAVIATGVPRMIDAAEVNGRFYMHKVVIGLLPSFAAGREKIRGKESIAAMSGLAMYWWRRLTRSRRFAIAIATADSSEHVSRVRALAVANNSYDEGFARFLSRERLDRGHLTVYAWRSRRPLAFIRLAAGMWMGRWQSDAEIDVIDTTSVTLRSHRKLHVAMIDGEITTLQMPATFRIRPAALPVLAPSLTETVQNEAVDPPDALGAPV